MGHYSRGRKFHGSIPYKFGWRVAKDHGLKATIESAIRTLERDTEARFIPLAQAMEEWRARQPEDESSAESPPNYISFTRKTRRGKIKRANGVCIPTGFGFRIGLGPRVSESVILHEVGHALGLRHEHQRRDRDRFVTIHWSNIKKAKKRDFEKTKKGDGHREGAYDYASIMHYGASAWAKQSGQTTISAKDGRALVYNLKLTAGDVRAINKCVR